MRDFGDRRSQARFASMLRMARRICLMGGVNDDFAYREARLERTPQRRLLKYLAAFANTPVVEDRYALDIVRELSTVTENCDGIDVAFDGLDDPLEGAVPLQQLESRLLQLEFVKAISDVENDSGAP